MFAFSNYLPSVISIEMPRALLIFFDLTLVTMCLVVYCLFPDYAIGAKCKYYKNLFLSVPEELMDMNDAKQIHGTRKCKCTMQIRCSKIIVLFSRRYRWFPLYLRHYEFLSLQIMFFPPWYNNICIYFLYAWYICLLHLENSHHICICHLLCQWVCLNFSFVSISERKMRVINFKECELKTPSH